MPVPAKGCGDGRDDVSTPYHVFAWSINVINRQGGGLSSISGLSLAVISFVSLSHTAIANTHRAIHTVVCLGLTTFSVNARFADNDHMTITGHREHEQDYTTSSPAPRSSRGLPPYPFLSFPPFPSITGSSRILFIHTEQKTDPGVPRPPKCQGLQCGKAKCRRPVYVRPPYRSGSTLSLIKHLARIPHCWRPVYRVCTG